MGQPRLDSGVKIVEGRDVIPRASNTALSSGRRPTREKTVAAIFWKTLSSRISLFITIIFLPSVFTPSAFGLESARVILKELDAHYYYPHQQGLKKLSLRLEWEQLDVSSGSGRYLKNPPAQFFWERTPAGAKSSFQLEDASGDIPAERRTRLLYLLENYKEMVIPKTLGEKMAGYEGRVKGVNDQKRLLEFVSSIPDARILKYSLMVDLGKKNVRRFRMKRKDKPYEVVSDVGYTQEDGKWLIAESRTQFRVGEMEYQETTEYVYRRVGNFWLAGKMTQTLKTDDGILQSFIFRFKDHQIN